MEMLFSDNVDQRTMKERVSVYIQTNMVRIVIYCMFSYFLIINEFTQLYPVYKQQYVKFLLHR